MTGVQEARLDNRALLLVVMAGLIFAVVAMVASVALAYETPRYRAETKVALLPGRNVPPQELASSWEALSRGQAARIAAEVLRQRRWVAPVAQSVGVLPASISITAGAIADTSLVNVGVEAGSPQAAEQAADALVGEARPVVEQVSGPFVLEILQPADGGATPIGTPIGQLLAVAGAAGLLIGSGGTLMVIRHGASWTGARGATGGAFPEEPVEEPTQWTVPPPTVPSDQPPNGPVPSPNIARPFQQ
jgi:capsular polysaccharide biosynthesis protein